MMLNLIITIQEINIIKEKDLDLKKTLIKSKKIKIKIKEMIVKY